MNTAFQIAQNHSSFTALKIPVGQSREEIRERYALLASEKLSDIAKEETKARLKEVSEDLSSTPQDLIDVLKAIPAFGFLFAQEARIIEGYSIEEHTSTVLGQLDLYFKDTTIKVPLTHAELRIAALLHDIGKSMPDEKSDQHVATLKVINDFKDILPLAPKAFEIIESLIENDPIGKYVIGSVEKFASKEERLAISRIAESRQVTREELEEFIALVTPKEITDDIKEQAKQIVQSFYDRSELLEVPVSELFALHILFYQIDTSAYTYGAVASNGNKALPGLDFLYVRLYNEQGVPQEGELLCSDESTGFLTFSEMVAAVMKEISIT